jgi:hypothetical protein
MITLQDDCDVAVVEGDVTVVPVVGDIVALHCDWTISVGVGRLKEPPVDQKLALKTKPARSANTANPTRERARVYGLLVRRVRRRCKDILGAAAAGRCTKALPTDC